MYEVLIMNDDIESTAYWTSPAVGDCTYAIHINDEYKSALKTDFTCKEEFKTYKEYVDTRLNNLKEAINTLRYSSSKHSIKGESHMMKKIKLVLVYGFAIFGLFTLVNDTILTNYKEELLRSYNCVTEYVKIHFHTAEHHAENWSTYSNEFKSKVWDSLSLHERINLTEIVNKYKQKTLAVKEFEKNHVVYKEVKLKNRGCRCSNCGTFHTTKRR